MLDHVDRFLNSITMYKLVLYGLVVLSLVGLALSATGLISFSLIGLLASLVILVSVSYIVNTFLGAFFKAPLSPESSIITALILFLIMAPISDLQDAYIAIATATVAMLSKFILAIGRKHLFNPAAIALVILGVLGSGNAFWWAGSSVLLPFVTIIGFLIVRKIHRFELVGSFMVSGIVTILLTRVATGADPLSTLTGIFTSWPLIFFATIMLTEPQTTPPTHKLQVLYGGLVGILFGLQFQIGSLYSTPELALVIGNLFSYLVSPKQKIWFNLQKVTKLSADIYHFDFTSPTKLQFTAGQYLEWTLQHHPVDLRGNRRSFTVASSPTESVVSLGVKIVPATASSYKKALLALKPGQQIVGTQISGSFTLPADPTQKLVFIAGGIGITPFRSMLKYLIDSNLQRDIILIYATSHPAEFVYQDIFKAAEKIVGLKTIFTITKAEHAPSKWSGLTGHLTAEMIKDSIPDYGTRTFYISGPDAMVRACQKELATLSVSKSRIVTDYFSGY